ncbi:hypothetical protein NSI01_49010 [Pimelobacter simplex]|nr:hypothetical protein NSI01_49010 [Pimelobacter simplex]
MLPPPAAKPRSAQKVGRQRGESRVRGQLAASPRGGAALGPKSWKPPQASRVTCGGTEKCATWLTGCHQIRRKSFNDFPAGYRARLPPAARAQKLNSSAVRKSVFM